MADPRQPFPGRHDATTGSPPDLDGRPRVPKEVVAICAVILVPLLVWLAYVGVSELIGPDDQAATADPPPKDLCALIGKERLGELVSRAKTTPQQIDRGDADRTYTRNCRAESDQSTTNPVYDTLQVYLFRLESPNPNFADERAESVFNSTCRDVAKRDIGTETKEIPIAGIDQLGEQSCGKASYSSVSESADVDIVVLRDRDVLHLRYDPDKTDDTTPQREMVQLAHEILAKL